MDTAEEVPGNRTLNCLEIPDRRVNPATGIGRDAALPLPLDAFELDLRARHRLVASQHAQVRAAGRQLDVDGPDVARCHHRFGSDVLQRLRAFDENRVDATRQIGEDDVVRGGHRPAPDPARPAVVARDSDSHGQGSLATSAMKVYANRCATLERDWWKARRSPHVRNRNDDGAEPGRRHRQIRRPGARGNSSEMTARVGDGPFRAIPFDRRCRDGEAVHRPDVATEDEHRCEDGWQHRQPPVLCWCDRPATVISECRWFAWFE